MIIQTHTTDRKALANAIAKELGVPCRYLGVPTCWYQAGDYVIDREGCIIGDDFTALRDFLQREGIAMDAASAAEEPAGNALLDSEAPETVEISAPVPEITTMQLKNLIFLLHSRQILINRMAESDMLNIPDALVEALKDHTPDTREDFEMLLADFEVRGFAYAEDCAHMVFPFDKNAPMKLTVYANLLNHIIGAAKAAKRVHPEKVVPDGENEKYLAHLWLQRLGYGGADLKEDRKLLLGHLKGWSAFPSAEKAKVHQDRHTALRRQARAEENNHAEESKEDNEDE